MMRDCFVIDAVMEDYVLILSEAMDRFTTVFEICLDTKFVQDSS